MRLPIPAFQEADLPERKTPLYKMIGPGVVMAGLAIGSGELIMWPWITSVVGAQLLWAAAIGIFLQLWVNIEIGRWTIVTGESPFTGMARVLKFLVYLFVFMIFVGKFLPGCARETGIALRDLIFGPGHDSPPWLWTTRPHRGKRQRLLRPAAGRRPLQGDRSPARGAERQAPARRTPRHRLLRWRHLRNGGRFRLPVARPPRRRRLRRFDVGVGARCVVADGDWRVALRAQLPYRK